MSQVGKQIKRRVKSGTFCGCHGFTPCSTQKSPVSFIGSERSLWGRRFISMKEGERLRETENGWMVEKLKWILYIYIYINITHSWNHSIMQKSSFRTEVRFLERSGKSLVTSETSNEPVLEEKNKSIISSDPSSSEQFHVWSSLSRLNLSRRLIDPRHEKQHFS